MQNDIESLQYKIMIIKNVVQKKPKALMGILLEFDYHWTEITIGDLFRICQKLS